MPPITFRSEINYVEVDAVVRDGEGRFVRDLRKDEIQLFENGKPQDVSVFSLVDMPVTRFERPLFTERTIDPDVRTNAGGQDGRIYVLFLDDYHTASQRSIMVRRAAAQFIQRNLGANDLAAVVHASGRQDAGQEFTDNQRLLLAAVNKFMGKKLRTVTQERIDEYNRLRAMNQNPSAVKDPLEFERAYNARVVLESLGNISSLLAGVSGRRKAIVMFSEGIEYDITDFMNNQSAITIINQTRDAISAATRANVNFYPVDPRGLTGFADEVMELSPPIDANPAMNLGMTGLYNEGRIAQDSLRTLAEGTGGFAALNSNDFSTAFQRIVDENSSYYVLGYYPTNDRRDGSFRKIEVKVSRPGMEVRARRGYVASKGKPPAAKGFLAKTGTPPVLAEALNSPIQVGGLAVSVFAAPLRGAAPKATIALVTQLGPLKGIAFAEKDGKFTNKLELSVIAVDPQGKVQGGTRDAVDLSLRPETYVRAQEFGFRIQSRFEIPPGRYQVRVAVKEAGGKVGSVHYDMVVPEFAKEPLSMSGLVVTATTAGNVPTAGEIPELKGMLRAPPTAARVFSGRDQLEVLAEVYDTQAQRHSVDITSSLRASDGRVAFSTSETRKSDELGGKTGGYGYTAVVPLSGLEPGLYVLRVEAKSTLAGASAVRETMVRIAR
jgi:VWFA-related protein